MDRHQRPDRSIRLINSNILLLTFFNNIYIKIDIEMLISESILSLLGQTSSDAVICSKGTC